ncbi:hypothetical protein Q5752_006654 [Cryptotrichosporon argae]
MSISLPNGAVVNLPREIAAPVSAAVTRILHMSNFNAELKTKDIVALFQEWAQDKGGYKIKWVDDTNVLIVFNDAHVAKRAYLSLILNRPAVLAPPAAIKPYDRPDAFKVIQQLNARAQGHGHRSSLSTTLTTGNLTNLGRDDSSLLSSTLGHARQPSGPSVPGASGGGFGGFKMPVAPGAAAGGPSSGFGSRQRMSAGSIGSMGGLGHQRAGSASSSWSRQSLSGALGFGTGLVAGPSAGAARLPTHSETSSADPSRSTSSSSNADPIVVLDAGSQLKSTAASLNGPRGPRRDSMTADKALREVQKALRSVEAQG